MTNNKQRTTKNNGGFTLIELLISMGVFVILLGIVINIFISSIRTQRSLVSLMAINDNASLGIEQMTRELRTGEDFSILEFPSDIEGDILVFTNALGATVSYREEDGLFKRGVCGEASCDNKGNFEFVPITGDNVVIKRVHFYLSHSILPGGPDAWPPRITMTMSVGSDNSDLPDIVTTDIQTTITTRNL